MSVLYDIPAWFKERQESMDAFRLNREDYQLALDAAYSTWLLNQSNAANFNILVAAIQGWVRYHNIAGPKNIRNR